MTRASGGYADVFAKDYGGLASTLGKYLDAGKNVPILLMINLLPQVKPI